MTRARPAISIRPMSIVVRYFASLREQLGRSEQRIEDAGGLPVNEVWRRATGIGEMPVNIRAAVNQEYVERDHAVAEGDEVAFFPPVTGGPEG